MLFRLMELCAIMVSRWRLIILTLCPYDPINYGEQVASYHTNTMPL